MTQNKPICYNLSTLQIKNEHYHHLEKGCKIIGSTFWSTHTPRYKIPANRCVTHKVDTCRCGWEWHFHGGEDIRLLPRNPRENWSMSKTARAKMSKLFKGRKLSKATKEKMRHPHNMRARY